MKKVKQFYVSMGLTNGFCVDVEVIGQSKSGDRIVVRPVSGSGSFEINKHQLRNSFRS